MMIQMSGLFLKGQITERNIVEGVVKIEEYIVKGQYTQNSLDYL